MVGKGYVVSHDLYSIADRIKEIDSNYFIFYNYRSKKYEVHCKNQRGSSLALVIPFDKLDVRTLRHVMRTRSERKRELIAEMEKHNAALLKKNVETAVKEAARQTEEILCQL